MGNGYRNIVITGFMGTGKSRNGRQVAQRLGWEFIDMDAVIEARAGKAIADIFAQDGEPAFRRMEADLCRELAEREHVVISTGGGALVDDANRRVLSRNGLVICLDCEFPELWRRLSQAQDRPMLYADDRRARMEELLARRAPAYHKIAYHLDTTENQAGEVAEAIVRLWQAGARVIAVRGPAGEYPIHVGRGLLAQAGELLRQRELRGKVGLVSNATVAPLHAPALEAGLRQAGLDVARCLMPDGEIHKTLETVRDLYDQFVAAGLARDSAIVALGGGVVGDVAGFAAATYMRGVALVQAPTTLLAMVDSSVGGKTAVDLPAGKNLVGAFKQAELVLADLDTLETLPPAELRSGLAEAIKHGVIAAPALFEHFERGGSATEPWALAEAIQVKVDVVEEDPYEQGQRAVLNLGHTFGHALEKLSDFRLRHGDAVSIGMVAAARLAVALGLAERALAERIGACLRLHGLPTALPAHAPETIWEAMGSDKKKLGGRLRFVLPRAIGDVIISDEVSREAALSVLQAMREEAS